VEQTQITERIAGRLEAGVNNTKWGDSSCHSFQGVRAGVVAPNLTHLADGTATAGDIYLTNYGDQSVEVRCTTPRAASRWQLSQHMHRHSTGGMDERKHKTACFLLKQQARSRARLRSV